jgi:CRP-like cAMP-binding protein
VNTSSAWIQRLTRLASLTPEEHALLEQAASAPRLYAAQEGLAKSGDIAEFVFVILDGLACEFKLLPDGRRQILSYLFAGDMSDARQPLMARWDRAMCVLWPARVALLSVETMQRLDSHGGLARAIGRYSLMKQAIAREWLVNVGHRTAFERLSHLLCEIDVRLETVGLTREHTFDLPLTQAEIGDTLALSAVHVNRTLMEMRRLKMVTFQNRQVCIHDVAALRAAAGFDPHYLQLEPASNPGHAN